MNESFDKIKREPLLPENHYKERLAFRESRLVDPKVDQVLASTDPEDDDRKLRLAWERASSTLEILIVRYSAGEDVATLKPYAVRAFDLLEIWSKRYDRSFKLWEPDAMAYVLWLLSLAVLFGLKEYIPQISSWISTDPDDGQDLLVSRLFARYNVKMPGETLIHEKPYADLLRATQTYGAEQQQAMTSYLKHWYRGMKNCYWHDRHKRLHAFFFGYWAFEAALVTLGWNIDDAPYRDMPYYPKDLVDYQTATRQSSARPTPTYRPSHGRALSACGALGGVGASPGRLCPGAVLP